MATDKPTESKPLEREISRRDLLKKAGRVGAGAVVGERDAALLELLEEARRLLLVQVGLLEELADGREVEATLLLALLQQRLESLVDCHWSGFSPFPRLA